MVSCARCVWGRWPSATPARSRRFLLNRKEQLPADGPWRCAVAGGVRVVSLERLDPLT